MWGTCDTHMCAGACARTCAYASDVHTKNGARTRKEAPDLGDSPPPRGVIASRAPYPALGLVRVRVRVRVRDRFRVRVRVKG